MKANDGKIAVTAYDAKTLEGYQIKGTTEHITEGAIVDTFTDFQSLYLFFSELQYFFAAYDFCRLQSAVRLTTTYAVSTMVPVKTHEIG